jgi:hypothetical protein
MEPEIRRAIPGDAKVVALLGRITFRETFGHLFLDHRDELRAYLDATFDVGKIGRSVCKPENAYWLAFVAGLPVGYAKLKHPSAPTDQGDQNAVQLQKIASSLFPVGSHDRPCLSHPRRPTASVSWFG